MTGLNIDTVASVSNKLEAGGELLQIVKWARLAQIDNRSDDFWYTLLMDAVVDPIMRRAGPDDAAGLKSALVFYSQYPGIIDITKHPFDESQALSNSGRDNFFRWGGSIVTIRKSRSFVTEGDAMGMGPPTTCLSDQVVVLHGASMPFILRPLGQGPGGNLPANPPSRCYSLVGSCYVNGMMDGEVFDCHVTKQMVCL